MVAVMAEAIAARSLPVVTTEKFSKKKKTPIATIAAAIATVARA